MGCQFFEVWKLVHTYKRSDNFAEHYANHMDLNNPSTRDTRKICKFMILWEGNLINLTKSFWTRNCKLCLQAKLHIVHRGINLTNKKLFNKRSEIEGAYRHMTSFYRLQKGYNSIVETGEHTPVCKKIWWRICLESLYVQAKKRACHPWHTYFRFGPGSYNFWTTFWSGIISGLTYGLVNNLLNLTTFLSNLSLCYVIYISYIYIYMCVWVYKSLTFWVWWKMSTRLFLVV